MALRGTLDDMSVSDVLQLPVLGNLTGLLRVGNEVNEARIYYRNGRIVDAVSSKARGEDVVMALLEYGEGGFTFETGIESEEQTIERDVQHLLLDGLRLIDERKEREAREREKIEARIGTESGLKEIMTSALSSAAGMVQLACLRSENGAFLSCWPTNPSEDSENMAVIHACFTMWNQKDRPWCQMLWLGNSGWVGAWHIEPGILLTMLSKKDAGLGQCHFMFKRAADSIKKKLNELESTR